MVSSLRNRGTMFQELRYPKTGTAMQSEQDSSIHLKHADIHIGSDVSKRQLETIMKEVLHAE